MLRLLKMLHWTHLWGTYSRYSSIALVINFTTYLILAHWFACAWVLIAENEFRIGYNDRKLVSFFVNQLINPPILNCSYRTGWVWRVIAVNDPNADIDPYDVPFDITDASFSFEFLHYAQIIPKHPKSA